MQSANGQIKIGTERGKTLYEWVRLSLRIADWDDISASNHAAALKYWLDSEESE